MITLSNLRSDKSTGLWSQDFTNESLGTLILQNIQTINEATKTFMCPIEPLGGALEVGMIWACATMANHARAFKRINMSTIRGVASYQTNACLG